MNASKQFQIVGVGFVAALGSLQQARAEVLFDQRSIAVNGTWNTQARSVIGGAGVLEQPIDDQVTDDFSLASSSSITHVVVDFRSQFIPLASPAGGFRVEFFQDLGGAPSNVAARTINSTQFERLGSFAENPDSTPALNGHPDTRATWRIALPDGSADLGAGNWWLAVQAVDLTEASDVYTWATYARGSDVEPTWGIGNVHLRHAGPAHGNSYSWGTVPFTEWWAIPGLSQDLSFRIEGIVPAPPAMLTLLLGVALQRRRTATR